MKLSRRSLLSTVALLAMFGQNVALADGPAQTQSDTLIYLHSIEPASLFQWWTQATYPKRQILDSQIGLRGLAPLLAKNRKRELPLADT